MFLEAIATIVHPPLDTESEELPCIGYFDGNHHCMGNCHHFRHCVPVRLARAMGYNQRMRKSGRHLLLRGYH